MENNGFAKVMSSQAMRLVLFLVGGLAVIIGGLVYVLITDLALINTSNWLFLGIFSSLGASVFTILSNNFKDKKWLFYLFKGLGILFSIGFVVVMILYPLNGVNPTAIKSRRTSFTEQQIYDIAKLVSVLGIILGSISVVGQLGDLAVNLAFGIDD